MRERFYSVLCMFLATESQLYWVQNVAYPNGIRAEIFDSNLGSFMKNTFVLELEYMFVQVSCSIVLLLDCVD